MSTGDGTSSNHRARASQNVTGARLNVSLPGASGPIPATTGPFVTSTPFAYQAQGAASVDPNADLSTPALHAFFQAATQNANVLFEAMTPMQQASIMHLAADRFGGATPTNTGDFGRARQAYQAFGLSSGPPMMSSARRPNPIRDLRTSYELDKPLRGVSIEIPEYHGEPDRLILDAHFRIVENYMAWKRVPLEADDESVQRFIIVHSSSRFKGPMAMGALRDAAQWAAIEGEFFIDYGQWKTAVYETFLPHNYAQLLFDDWEYLRNAGKGASQFASDILAVNMRLQNVFTDEMMRQKFLARIPGVLRAEMDRSNTSVMSFRDTVSLASRLESSVLTSRRGTGLPVQKPTNVAPVKSRQIAVHAVQETDEFQEPEEIFGEEDDPYAEDIEVAANDVSNRSGACRKCGQKGHWARECRSAPQVNLVSMRNSQTSNTEMDVAEPAAIVLEVGGEPMRCLLDGGSQLMLVNNATAHLHKLATKKRREAVPVASFVRGSKAQLSAYAEVEIRNPADKASLGIYTMEVAPLNRWDAIIGMPLLRRLGAYYDPESNRLQLPKLSISIPCEELEKDNTGCPSSVAAALVEPSADELHEKAVVEGLRRELESHPCLVEKMYAEPPPHRVGLDHEIPLIDDGKLATGRPPKLPYALREAVKEYYDEGVKSGRKVPSLTYNRTTVLALLKPRFKREREALLESGKPAGPITREQIRIVLDLRERNKNTKKVKMNYPDISEIQRLASTAKYISIIDMPEAFHQFALKESDIPKSGEWWWWGTVVSVACQQGDCNSPATCQRGVNVICAGIPDAKGYMDDIHILTQEQAVPVVPQEHADACKKVMDQMHKLSFVGSKKKSRFFVDREDLIVLGDRIIHFGIGKDPRKVQCILDFPAPKTVKDVEKFLGMVNALGRHAPESSILGQHLSTTAGLARKQNRYMSTIFPKYQNHRGDLEWGDSQDKAFNRLKEACSGDEFLKPRRMEYQLWLLSDASDGGAGGVWVQTPTADDEWEKGEVLAFYSHAWTATETYYPVHEREYMAGIIGLHRFSDWCFGQKVIWLSDNTGCQLIGSQISLSPRMVRLVAYANNVDLETRRISGEDNAVADAISRIYQKHSRPHPICEPQVRSILEIEDDWVEQSDGKPSRLPGVSPQVGAVLTTMEMGDEPTLEERAMLVAVQDAYTRSVFFQSVISHIGRYPDYHLEEGLLCFRNRLVIPKRTQFQDQRSVAEELVHRIHVSLAHAGLHALMTHVRAQYLLGDGPWTVCRKVIDKCVECTAGREHFGPGYGNRQMVETQEGYPWSEVAIDFIGPFPEAEHPCFPGRKVNFIMHVMCLITSESRLIPMRMEDDAMRVACYYFHEVYRTKGLPESVVSDRDPRFTSAFWKSLNQIVGVRQRMSVAYHPNTNGQNERRNREIGRALRTLSFRHQEAWANYLTQVEFGINSRAHTRGKASPFELTIGYQPAFMRRIGKGNSPKAMNFVKEAMARRQEVADLLRLSRLQQNAAANEKLKPVDFADGDRVWVSTRNMALAKEKPVSRKLSAKWMGPIEIVRSFPRIGAYELDMPLQFRGHPTFSIRDMKKDHTGTMELVTMAPPNEEFGMEGSESLYEVEMIVGHERSGKGFRYEIKWKGYDSTQNTLEPARNMIGRGAKAMLLKYQIENNLLSDTDSDDDQGTPTLRRGLRRSHRNVR